MFLGKLFGAGAMRPRVGCGCDVGGCLEDVSAAGLDAGREGALPSCLRANFFRNKIANTIAASRRTPSTLIAAQKPAPSWLFCVLVVVASICTALLGFVESGEMPMVVACGGLPVFAVVESGELLVFVLVESVGEIPSVVLVLVVVVVVVFGLSFL